MGHSCGGVCKCDGLPGSEPNMMRFYTPAEPLQVAIGLLASTIGSQIAGWLFHRAAQARATPLLGSAQHYRHGERIVTCCRVASLPWHGMLTGSVSHRASPSDAPATWSTPSSTGRCCSSDTGRLLYCLISQSATPIASCTGEDSPLTVLDHRPLQPRCLHHPRWEACRQLRHART